MAKIATARVIEIWGKWVVLYIGQCCWVFRWALLGRGGALYLSIRWRRDIVNHLYFAVRSVAGWLIGRRFSASAKWAYTPSDIQLRR